MKSVESPINKFVDWIREEGFDLKNSIVIPDLPFSLATASKDAFPTVRILYLKKLHSKEEEFIFFTNKNSKKGKNIAENNRVSMCFFFEETFRQIRIEGRAFLGSREETEKYFDSRPPSSKVGAIVSKQSDDLENYEQFIEDVNSYTNAHKDELLKCPEHWVCYKVIAEEFEFWEGREFRLHLRTKYKKDLQYKNLWNMHHLYP